MLREFDVSLWVKHYSETPYKDTRTCCREKGPNEDLRLSEQ